MRNGRVAAALFGAALGIGVACQLDAPPFLCFADADCLDNGACELPERLCSQPDPQCGSQRRYTESAADRAGQCVPGSPDPTDPTNGESPDIGGPCSDADDCEDDGFCEVTGWCGYRDDTCPAGRRYGRSDDASLEGECVESAACEEVIDDKFQDEVLDSSTWFVRPGFGGEESWVVQANSRLNYRLPMGAEDGTGASVASLDTFNFNSGRIEVDISRPPSEALYMVVGFESTDVGSENPFLGMELYAGRIDLWTASDFEMADVDYGQTPVVAIQVDGANVTVEVSEDGSEFEEVLSARHEAELSTARPVLNAWVQFGTTLESDETVSFGSVEVCAVE